MRKFNWLILFVTLSMLLSIALSCGDDDDDDDDDGATPLTTEQCEQICDVLINCMGIEDMPEQCVEECTEGVQDDCSDCFIQCDDENDTCEDFFSCLDECPCEDVDFS